jgi:hypothetical protein
MIRFCVEGKVSKLLVSLATNDFGPVYILLCIKIRNNKTLKGCIANFSCFYHLL